MTISDRMAVLMEGRIEQIGTADEVLAHPKTLDSPPSSALRP